MTSVSEATQALELVSQKHEKEIVIEFGPDRILQYIGVYLVAFLAAVAKISELAASSLSCHPAGNFSVDSDFISYANDYCWESSTVINPTPLASDPCNTESVTSYEKSMLHNPSFFKTFTRLLPYAMIFEAILFSFPSLWWHIRVGAKLMGHLKFMKFLLNDIYEAVKPIPTGIYKTNHSYDCDSYYLDASRGFQPNYKRKGEPTNVDSEQGCCWGVRQRLGKGKAKRSSEAANNEQQGVEDNADQNNNQKQSSPYGMAQIALGEMKDRHLFSMFCFENFSSLEHHPYILSVYKLSRIPNEPSDKGFIGSKTKGILRLLCNKNNFSGTVLVQSYLYRHLLGIVSAVIVLTATGMVLNYIVLEGWNAESFRCDVIYHFDVCMICTIRRKLDMIVLLLVNLCIAVFYLATSFYQLIYVRRSSNRATSHYFEEISDTGSAALKNI